MISIITAIMAASSRRIVGVLTRDGLMSAFSSVAVVAVWEASGSDELLLFTVGGSVEVYLADTYPVLPL